MPTTSPHGHLAPAGDADATVVDPHEAGADGSSLVTPNMLFESVAEVTVRTVRRRPALVASVSSVFLVGALAGAVAVAVRAWTSPTLLDDGVFVHATGGTVADTALLLLLALGVGVLDAAVLGGVVLATAADALDRELRVREVVRELGRRWALLLVCLVVSALALLVPVALVLLTAVWAVPFAGVLIAVPLAVAVVQLVAVGAQPAVAALLHGTTLRAAVHRVRTLRERGGAREQLRRGRVLAVTAVVGAALPVVVVRWLTADASAWTPAREGVQAALGSVALTAAVVGLTWAHVSATSAAERRGAAPLAWRGAARATAAVARAGSGRAARSRGWAVAGWASAAGAWLLVPLLALAPTLPGVTPAVRAEAIPMRDYVVDPMLAGTADGVLVVDRTSLDTDWGDDRRAMDAVVCSAAEGCVRGPRRLDTVVLDRDALASDPDGPGAVLLAAVFPDDGTPARYDLITCTPVDCGDPGRRTTQVEIAQRPGPGDPELHAVAARDGAYAAVHPVRDGEGEDAVLRLVLTTCATALCPEPVTLPLGSTSGDDLVDVEIAPDGTVWVLRSQGAVVHLARREPGGTSLVDVQVLEPGAAQDSLRYTGDDDPLYARVLALAVRDDGTPVVLQRDLSDGGIDLLSCADAECSRTTSSRLPGGAARDAELAVDGTGRPLVVTVGVGVQLHACRDDACSRVRSGLLSTTGPGWGLVDREPDPFLAVDGKGRPAVLVEREFGEAVVVQCREPRCGL